MKRRTRHTIIAMLTTFLVTVALVEGGLRLIDPWKVNQFFSDMAHYFANVRADDRRDYVLAPDSYRFSNWQAEILPDGTRRVPDTNTRASCTLALVGDSVTFAYGVSDADTWANVLARAMPDVHILNTGVNGYNTLNALQTVRAIPAHAYLYLLVSNDPDGPFPWQANQKATRGALISEYLYFLMGGENQQAVHPSFYPALDALTARRDVTIVTFANWDTTPSLRIRYPAIHWIAEYHGHNSRVDGHANAQGNREIAAAILPVARALIERTCPVI